jgi:hypothetical protein
MSAHTPHIGSKNQGVTHYCVAPFLLKVATGCYAYTVITGGAATPAVPRITHPTVASIN